LMLLIIHGIMKHLDLEIPGFGCIICTIST
jgi:hypothetical protein